MYSDTLKEYIAAVHEENENFLIYYSLDEGKNLIERRLSSHDFLSLVRKAYGVLKRSRLHKGRCYLSCFSRNDYKDLAFRTAAAFMGVVPVTVNWQADNPGRVVYKADLTGASLAVCDAGTAPEYWAELKGEIHDIERYDSQELENEEESSIDFAHVSPDSNKIIIFTSGTTGLPKGVMLPFRSYETNKGTFERFLDVEEDEKLSCVIVNPLHHTNSTAISDWALRRPGSSIYLFERYTSAYWQKLCEIRESAGGRVVAPAVARHFDFLENLDNEGKLSIDKGRMKAALSNVDFLVGSAPVGPTTVERFLGYTGRPPIVRFGSTESCLQVCGIPAHLSSEERLEIFKRGWKHNFEGQDKCGYYIGREHEGYTEVQVVRSVEKGSGDYLEPCEYGESGYIVCRGANLMKGYVQKPEETEKVFSADGWYLGFGDVCFVLKNENDGGDDIFWLSRESMMLIKGGANYAYEQINAELKEFAKVRYGLTDDEFDIAVCGLKLVSEHEDSVCVSIELSSEHAKGMEAEIAETFKAESAGKVSKGAKPDILRIGDIPRNFKGAVLVKELKAYFTNK